MPPPTRVLLAVSHGGAGGMQVQVGLLAQGLAAAGLEVTVAAGPGPLPTGDVEIVRLPGLAGRSAPAFARALRSVVRQRRPDVLHAHGLRLSPFVRVAGAPHSLVTCHGIDPDRAGRVGAALRHAGVHVASCGEGPRRLLAARGVASRVLDNAVPPMPVAASRAALAERFGLSASSPLVVSPARLSSQKDPITLVRALAHARDVSGLLLGGGPLDAEVRGEIDREGLTGRVVVSGWLDDARSVLGGADVLALASRWEGQPTVVLEAMSSGVAVVATACPGTAETVVDGVTGVLVPVGDAVSLGAALSKVGTDVALRARLAAAGRLQATSHRVEVVVAQHVAAYDQLRAGRWP